MTPDQLNVLVNVLSAVTLFEMMVTIGMGVTLADVAGVARKGRLVGKAAVANYICFPAFAVGLLLLFRAPPLVAAGFLVAAVCPGAPYGPPFTGLARGNVVTSVGLMVLLAGSSAVVAPILLQVLLPITSGDAQVQIDVGKMIGTLIVAQFLPLCLGLGLRWRYSALADRLKKPAGLLSTVLNLTTLCVILVAQFDMLTAIPLRALAGMLALVLAGVAAGWLLGGPDRGDRTATAMATSVRNVGVSLVIATGSFPGTPAVTAATAFAIFQTVAVALIAVGWGRLCAAPVLEPGAETTATAPPKTSCSD